MNEFLTWNNWNYTMPSQFAIVLIIGIAVSILGLAVAVVAYCVDLIDTKFLWVPEYELDWIDRMEGWK